jgi:hypothetical protein
VTRVLHLVRPGSTLPSWAPLVAPDDWVVDLDARAPRLRDHGAPPRPPGPIDFDELHRLLAAAERVVTW